MSIISQAKQRTTKGISFATEQDAPSNTLIRALALVSVLLLVICLVLLWRMNTAKQSSQALPIMPSFEPILAEPASALAKPKELVDVIAQTDAPRWLKPVAIDIQSVDLLSLRQQYKAPPSAIIATESAPIKRSESSSQAAANGETAENLPQTNPELLARFTQALVEQEQAQLSEAPLEDNYDMLPHLATLDSAISSRVPPLLFQSHVFSSDPARRYVQFNSREYTEGAEVAPNVILEAIRRDDVILNVNGVRCRLGALADWD